MGMTSKLQERYDAPGEAHRSDEYGERHCDRRHHALPASALRLDKLRERYERRRSAAEAVVGRDHLGHRRHLHPLRRDGPGDCSQEGGDTYQQQVLKLDDEECRNEGYDHADGGQGVARAGSLRFTQATDADDEQRGRHKVGQERCELQELALSPLPDLFHRRTKHT